MAATFEGFSTEALAFYEGLEDDNSKAYDLPALRSGDQSTAEPIGC
jgi:hypothetical protein